MEYWVIDKNWRTIRSFTTLDDAEHYWNNDRPEYAMQLIGREGHYKPIRVIHSI